LELQEHKNGKVVPEEVMNGDEGVEAILFDASFKKLSEKTLQNLEFIKFGEDSPMTQCWAKCCGTIMCSAHVLYHKQSILVHQYGPEVRIAELPELAGATWTSFIPEGKPVPQKYADLPEFRGDEENLGEVPFLQWYLEQVSRPFDQQPEHACNFTELQQACGDVITLPKMVN
jgi:hypothetical protein